MRACLAIAALIAGFGAASAGTAQQITLPPVPDAQAAEFAAVGRVNTSGFRVKGNCTGTLIAPDLVLTAAHCTAKGTPGRSKRVFVAGYARGDFIAARRTLEEWRHPAYAPDGAHGPRNDVGLHILRTPITDVAPIPLADLEDGALDGTDVALLGYHRAIPHLLTGRFDCPVTQFQVGLVHVGCPVISGNSGGPILQQDETGTWRVVGVVSSQLGREAIAVEIPDWVWREVASRAQR